MPVRQRSGRTVGRLESWTGVASVSWAFQPFDIPTFRPTTSSTSVFHAPHASQRPPHFGCSAPQSVQRYTERALAMTDLRRRLARGVVVEAGVFLLEEQLHGPGGPVALLADDQVGQPLEALVGLEVDRSVVELLTINEADDVGVLLDGAGFAQVRQLGPPMLATALLRRARQLRQGEHRDIQLFGERLERPGNKGDLLLAALRIAGPLHHLQVIDDHHADVVLGLEAARLGARGEPRAHG